MNNINSMPSYCEWKYGSDPRMDPNFLLNDTGRILEILKNYTLREVVEKYGYYPLNRTGKNVRSDSYIDPGTSKKNENNKVNYEFDSDKEYFFDMSVQCKGDLIDFIMMTQNLEFWDAVAFLEKEKGLISNPEKIKPENTKLLRDIKQYHNTLFEDKFKPILEYLKEKKGKLTDEEIEINYIGVIDHGNNARIVFPIFANEDKQEPKRVVNFEAEMIPKELGEKIYPNYVEQNNKFYYPTEKDYKDELENIPFNYWRALKQGKEIYITEGVNDSINLFQCGLNNLCTSGGSGTKSENWNKYFIPILKGHENIIIFSDNDDTGRKAIVNWIRKNIFSNRIYNVSVQIVPKTLDILDSKDPFKDHFLDNDNSRKIYGSELLKDVNDLYRAGGEDAIKKAKDTRITALEYIARYYLDSFSTKAEVISEFNKVIRSIYRHMDSFILKSQIKALEEKELFNSDEIKEILEVLNKSPLDALIVNELIENNKPENADGKKIKEDALLYSKKLGFYQYNGKFWEEINEEYIRGQIEELLGFNYANGAKLNSVFTTLKDRLGKKNKTDKDLEFNKKDLLVFNNGTLYLNDGKPEFKKDVFNPNDRVTYINNFDFDREAQCPLWRDYIDSVTETYEEGVLNVEESSLKRLMLQEFAGYILFNDCNFQKALVMFGDGDNGKSVYFNTLESVFNPKATTRVKAQSLGKEYNTILLKDSLLNISGETKQSFIGAEETIKELVVGETQTDREIYKSPISFRPRAKLIFSANNPFKVVDESDGFSRRLLFVFFRNKYTTNKDEINGTDIKPKDLNLEDKLKDEIPGIFNWILTGYEELKFKQKNNLPMVESQECRKQYEEFKISNNPIREFIIYSLVGDYSYIDHDFLALPNLGQKKTIENGDLITVWIPREYALADYKAFTKERNYKAKGNRQFRELLIRTGKDMKIKITTEQHTVKGERMTYYCFYFDKETEKKLIELDTKN